MHNSLILVSSKVVKEGGPFKTEDLFAQAPEIPTSVSISELKHESGEEVREEKKKKKKKKKNKKKKIKKKNK